MHQNQCQSQSVGYNLIVTNKQLILSSMEQFLSIKDFESRALEILDTQAKVYYGSGADDEITLRENVWAFARWLVRPRILRGLSTIELSTTVLGKPVEVPIGIAPAAFQSLVHETAEIQSAQAAASCGTIFVLSTYANWSIEDIAAQTTTGRKWFQLFPNSKISVTLDLIKRVENAGYEALVVSLDAQNFGNKRAITRNSFTLPPHLKIANLERYEAYKIENIPEFVHSSLAQNLDWKTIKFIQRNTTLPVILKGILSESDALTAVEYGVQGIWVSNHGGRQVDTAVPSIDILPKIVKTVNGRCEVYLDSGVRNGTDVFKAPALGATMVFVGRPPIWGVAVGASEGAKRVLNIFKGELKDTMAVAGVARVKDISVYNLVRSKGSSSKL